MSITGSEASGREQLNGGGRVRGQGQQQQQQQQQQAGLMSQEEVEDLMDRKELLLTRLEMVLGGGKEGGVGLTNSNGSTITAAAAAAAAGGKSTVPPKAGDVHWDFLLKEMQWMATDFEQERASHLRQRKKCGKAVVSYFEKQGSREERLVREEQERRRRVAGRIAREVKGFWKKVNKVVAFKQKLEVDEGRKRAMDKHLSFLVGQTERYSKMVARNMVMGREGRRDGGRKSRRRRRRRTAAVVLGGGGGTDGEGGTEGGEEEEWGREGEEEEDDGSFSLEGEEGGSE